MGIITLEVRVHDHHGKENGNKQAGIEVEWLLKDYILFYSHKAEKAGDN